MVEQPSNEINARLAEAQSQLAEARAQLIELEELLRELPEIFERKFQQRLQPVLERQSHLVEDNRQLRQQLRQLTTAAAADIRQLPPQDQAA
jgi:chromosome segregation ATPase